MCFLLWEALKTPDADGLRTNFRENRRHMQEWRTGVWAVSDMIEATLLSMAESLPSMDSSLLEISAAESGLESFVPKRMTSAPMDIRVWAKTFFPDLLPLIL